MACVKPKTITRTPTTIAHVVWQRGVLLCCSQNMRISVATTGAAAAAATTACHISLQHAFVHLRVPQMYCKFISNAADAAAAANKRNKIIALGTFRWYCYCCCLTTLSKFMFSQQQNTLFEGDVASKVNNALI